MHQELLDQVRAALRLKHYSIRTEQPYVDWIERFICFNGDRSPRTWAALKCKLSSPTSP